MGALHTDIARDENTVRHDDIEPDIQTWMATTQIPLTVIVGLDDTAELPRSLIPGQKGNNQLFIAKNWIQDMAIFAETNGLTSQFSFKIITGQGHAMSGLLAFSQAALVSERNSFY